MTLEQAIKVLTLELGPLNADSSKILEDTLTKLATHNWREGYSEGTVDSCSEGEDL
jgi:hypothetical protein